MPDASHISCALCLRLLEPQGLIEIPLPHDQFRNGASAQLCQECCAAVLETCVQRHEDAAPSASIEGAGETEESDQAHSDHEAE